MQNWNGSTFILWWTISSNRLHAAGFRKIDKASGGLVPETKEISAFFSIFSISLFLLRLLRRVALGNVGGVGRRQRWGHLLHGLSGTLRKVNTGSFQGRDSHICVAFSAEFLQEPLSSHDPHFLAHLPLLGALWGTVRMKGEDGMWALPGLAFCALPIWTERLLGIGEISKPSWKKAAYWSSVSLTRDSTRDVLLC